MEFHVQGDRVEVIANLFCKTYQVDMSWLANLAMAIGGTRYLEGDDSAASQLPWVDDVSFYRLDRDGGESAAAFLGRLRDIGAGRLELVWLGGFFRDGASDFALEAQPSGDSWRLHSTFSSGWTSKFHPCALPDLVNPRVNDATSALAGLLDATADHPVDFHRQAVEKAQSVLAGGVPMPDDLFDIRIDRLKDDAARLLTAAIAISAGKLSGMGGFNDAFMPGVDPLDVESIVGRAVAASTMRY